MSRTLTDIYNALATEKAAQPELEALVPELDNAQQLLSDLNTPSRVARWRLMLWVVAVAIWVHERLWDIFKAEVDALAARSSVGTRRWYQEQALAFQFGYDLVEGEDGVFRYEEDVPESRIVVRAAVAEQSGTVLLKVARMNAGALAPLTAPQLIAFAAYLAQVKMAGTIINLLSAAPDLLKVQFVVYYNPLVLSGLGELITDDAVKPVEVAINDYIKALPFNGELRLTALVDAVQRAVGVEDPRLISAEAKYGFLPYAAINTTYTANAGHMIIDPANPLSANITYLPYVA
jgi:hypothetical protein